MENLEQVVLECDTYPTDELLIKIDADMVSIKMTNDGCMYDDDNVVAIVEFELEKAIKLRDALNVCINNLQLIN